MATKKPTISKKEKSYHEVKASIRGRKLAAQQGADPTHIEALMDDGKGLTVKGYTLKPLNLGIVWALQKVGSVYSDENTDNQPKQVDWKDLVIAALCFVDPTKMFNLGKEGNQEEIDKMVFEMGLEMDPVSLAMVNEYINRQMPSTQGDAAQEMQKEADAAAKKPAEHSQAAKES